MTADEMLQISFTGKMKASSSKWIKNVVLQMNACKSFGVLTMFMLYYSQLYY